MHNNVFSLLTDYDVSFGMPDEVIRYLFTFHNELSYFDKRGFLIPRRLMQVLDDLHQLAARLQLSAAL